MFACFKIPTFHWFDHLFDRSSSLIVTLSTHHLDHPLASPFRCPLLALIPMASTGSNSSSTVGESLVDSLDSQLGGLTLTKEENKLNEASSSSTAKPSGPALAAKILCSRFIAFGSCGFLTSRLEGSYVFRVRPPV